MMRSETAPVKERFQGENIENLIVPDVFGAKLTDAIFQMTWIVTERHEQTNYRRAYDAICDQTKLMASIHVECKNNPVLTNEIFFGLQYLMPHHLEAWIEYQGITFIPIQCTYTYGTFRVRDFGEHKFLVTQQLGNSLEYFFNRCGRHMEEVGTFQVALNMLYALEYIHSCGFVHNDIKPRNMLFGMEGRERNQIYLSHFKYATEVGEMSK